MHTHAPIGVFDSGVGGLSILAALRERLPQEHYVYLADSGHAPYGERDDAHVVARSLAVARHLVGEHRIRALVVACNTATAAAIALLRVEHPQLPIIGVEPALKPALVSSRTRRIAVLATRSTLGSRKFRTLHDRLAGQAEFICQPCDGLAEAIERALATGDNSKTIALCDQYTRACGSFGSEHGAIDTLVLGCTHYVFASAVLQSLVGPDVRLIETGPPVARQTARLTLDSDRPPGPSCLLSTGDASLLQAAGRHWLQLDWPAYALTLPG